MKILLAAAACLVLSTALVFAQGPRTAEGPFAVVELFASEGCSDCPPADDLLKQITAYARTNNKRIFTLSFQVDYWNYLGWNDPFSKPEYSQRQQRYSAFLPGGVYTPEMIINGREAFVGSNAQKAKTYTDHYLTVAPKNSITLDFVRSGDGIKIHYSLGRKNDNAVINFALVERGLESHPDAGENEGKKLEHDNVVREFKTISLDDTKGTIEFPDPQEQDLTRYSVIAYVQSKDDMSILAASDIDLK